MAVFEFPLTLATRAFLPTAVFRLPVVVAKEGERSVGRVLHTLGVGKERVTAGGGVFIAGGIVN